MKTLNACLLKVAPRGKVDLHNRQVVEVRSENSWVSLKRPVRGLSKLFAQLKSNSDIDSFAHEYGLLGVVDESMRSGRCISYGVSHRESLILWRYHINIVQNMRKTYYTLKRAQKNKEYDVEEALHRLLLVVDNPILEHPLPYAIVWTNDRETVLACLSNNELITQELASRCLAWQLARFLEGGLMIWPNDLVPSQETPLGFRLVEQVATRFLLAAIYCDIWEMITEARPVTLCANPECGLVIEKNGRRKYCNDACKQAAYRARHTNK